MHRIGMIVAVSASLVTPMGSFETALAQEEIKLGGRRIVGGVKTDIRKHPWQVALTISGPDGNFLCGGSIIANKWVLTAAHCFVASDTSRSIKAKTGATDLVKQGRWSDVATIVIHEGYDPRTYDNDIALVRLKSKPSGKVIPLASKSIKISVGQPLEVTGWGAISEDGDASRDLLKANVPYVLNGTCNEPASYNGNITSGMMCAGRREGGVDSCQGDSGGPLVWRTPDGPVLVGVVSWGVGCARKLNYGVYTRVGDYRDWIARTMAANKR